ncbi:hypothetical protein [Shewanella aestuarii]|uniref:Uncharacterized protein n=1 Tax=Shewanella aestuarii TaxID=1028752 RepID=A0A6G9QNH3_9GAMM|nr:hypothetical protein [Shewanella aestuarii]QIR15389.1 hypothetical protein HBH39_13530 [Shewanella aestuarii]
MNSRLLLIAGLLACPFTVSQGVADTSVNFSTISHQADFELTQPIISANVLSLPGKELLAFGVDDKRQRWLAIYGLLQMDNIEPQLVLLDKVILSHDLFRYDILDADELKLAATNATELQTLYFLNSQALLQYLPASQTAIDKPKSANQNGRIEEVAAVNSITILPRGDFISRGDFVAHINNDAIADVIISDFRTAHLLLGTQQGEFARQSIPILPIVELTSEGRSTAKHRFIIPILISMAYKILLRSERECWRYFINFLLGFLPPMQNIYR